MDKRAAEILTARTVGVLLVESVIRQQTAIVLVGLLVAGAVAVVLGVVVGGAVGILLGVIGFVLLVVAGFVYIGRRAALSLLHRVGGGREHAVARPIVARHMDDARSLLSDVSLQKRGTLSLLTMVANKSAVMKQVTSAGHEIVDRLPRLVEEVRVAASAAEGPAA